MSRKSLSLLLLLLLLATGIVRAGDGPVAERDPSDAEPQAVAAAPEPQREAGAAEPQANGDTPEAERDPGATEPKAVGEASGDESDPGATEPPPQTEEGATVTPVPGGTALGMSILGNQEAPKSLVIVPWKSSEIGDAVGISTILDDSRQPIDKEVFMRALTYYEIRSTSNP